MAQNEGANSQRPPPGPTAQLAAGLAEVVESQELLRDLCGMLTNGDAAEELAARAMETLTRGLALLREAESGISVAMVEKAEEKGCSPFHSQLSPSPASPSHSGATEESTGGSRRRRKDGATGGVEKKAGHRRRTHPYAWRETTSTTLDDGYTWRKYGQKDIQNSSEPRSYYRCTYKKSHGCQARRQVQNTGDGSGVYNIHYFGEHICTRKLPADASHIVYPKKKQAQKQTQVDHPLATTVISFVAEATAIPIPAPLKKEAATAPSRPAKVVEPSSDAEAKPDVMEAASLPALCAYTTEQQGDASPGQSSVGSGVNLEDMEYMGSDFDLTSLITLDAPDFSMLYFSS